MAVDKYKKNGKGITFNDLRSAGLAPHKQQAQITLKRCLRMNLFTLGNYKPQQYYPICFKSEIVKKLLKNIPVGVTEVPYSSKAPMFLYVNKSNNNDIIINQTLGYVLPLLPSAPLFIHKMQLKLKISPEYYNELKLPIDKGNKGKEHIESIGRVRVNYLLYSNGTIMVFTESSNNPFKLEDETDRSRLLTFFGQVRDRLVTFLADTYERIVPEILEWELTQCDINRDIKVGDGLQYTGIKVQVKHFDHLFRVYIKSNGKDTVCRVEESLNPKKPAIQAINEIFCNLHQREQQESSTDSDSSTKKIIEIHDMVKSILLLILRKDNSKIGEEQQEGQGS